MKRQAQKLKVEFIDDNDEFLEKWRADFRKRAPKDLIEVIERPRDAIRDTVKELDNFRRRAREPNGTSFDPNATPYADSDIILIDYDLLALEETTCLTGEDIAYLLRCFSTCGLIILLNPPDLGTNFFDLRLRRSMDSWADLVLGTDQLDNAWLWAPESAGFAPWSWPNLPTAVVRRRKQIQSLQRALDKPVLDVLGFPETARLEMDHVMADVVTRRSYGSERTKPQARNAAYSIREFVLDSGYGVHRRDKESFQNENEEQLAQIAAARISSWLEFVVLPAQSVLVDAPHLVSRLPRLLAGDPSKLASWNATRLRQDADVMNSVKHRDVAGYRLTQGHWLSRPVWFWPEIVNDKNYFEWAHSENTPDVVFCEDTSSFVKRSQAQQFMAEVPAKFALRYVQMAGSSGEAGRPQYRPSVRLSM